MPSVLIVDDDPALRETTYGLLVEEGYEVLEAPDGVEALELLRSVAVPVVVLLDIRMPRASGVDVLTLVGGDERLTRHQYVVWAASRVPLANEILDELGVPVLSKPFNVDDLLALLAQASERLERQRSG